MPVWPDPRTRSTTTVHHSPPLDKVLKILVVASRRIDSGVITTGQIIALVRPVERKTRAEATWSKDCLALPKSCQDADNHLTDTTSYARVYHFPFHGSSTRFRINPRLPLPPSAGTRRHARARRTNLA
jgi:hypothetical protein